MKFTKNWLFDYLQTNLKLEDILEGLLSIGLEVEQVIDYANKLKEFTVAEIISANKHPNADKLQVCNVNTAKGVKEIVCGAPNARAGIKVIFADSNTFIPGLGVTLKESEIRGIKSSGMMLSEKELDISNNHGSIIEVASDFKVGDVASKALGLDDALIEVAVTPNLGYLLSVQSIAKALAAKGLGKFKPKLQEELLKNIWFKNNTQNNNNWQYFNNYADSNLLKTTVSDSSALNSSSSADTPALNIEVSTKISGAFVAIKLTGVNNNVVTPLWIQNRLKLIGQNLISPLVDITNYLTIDLNHPMHAYDSKTLGKDITVVEGNNKDSILTLDHKEYNNLEGIPLVKSNNKAIALAGIMGSENFSVTNLSNEVILECAHFYPLEVTKASKKLAINTTSSYHFQRGVNPFDLLYAANSAINLIKEICGCDIETTIIIQNLNNTVKVINTSTQYINDLLGTNLSPEVIVDYLSNQEGFKVEGVSNKLEVEVPYYRNDIEQECDLAETVLKAYGINNILPKELSACVEESITNNATTTNIQQNKKEQNCFTLNLATKKSLASLGLLESINMSFIAEKTAKLFDIYDDELKLLNPISIDLSVMRKSLIPSLVQAASNNSRLGYSNIAFFEVSNVYNALNSSSLNAAAILSGAKHKKDWYHKEQNYNTFDIKILLFNLINSLGVNTDKFKISKEGLPTYYHPGRSGSLLLGNTPLAYFGELHPKLTEYFNLKNNPAIFELLLEAVPLPKLKLPLVIKELPKLMPLERDFAFIVDNNISAIELVRIVASVNKQLISDVRIFDVFSNKDMVNKKSIAFTITVTPKVTLTDSDINNLSQQIITVVNSKLGGKLRDENLKI